MFAITRGRGKSPETRVLPSSGYELLRAGVNP